MTLIQNDSSADYPWRNSPEHPNSKQQNQESTHDRDLPENQNINIEEQDQQPTSVLDRPVNSPADAKQQDERSTQDANISQTSPDGRRSPSSSSWLSSLRSRAQRVVFLQGRSSRLVGTAPNDGSPTIQTSAEDSTSTDTTQSMMPKSGQESRGPDGLIKFRVHHYFDYVAGTSTGG